MARIWHEATRGDLDRLAIPARLFIDPDHRKNGAGGALLAAIRGHAEPWRRGRTTATENVEPAAVYVVDRVGPS